MPKKIPAPRDCCNPHVLMSLFVDEDELVLNEAGQPGLVEEQPRKFNPDVVEAEEEVDLSDHPVSCSLPLGYQQKIFEDMLRDDSLLILGRGLGFEPITVNLLHALSTPTKVSIRRPLIILLLATDLENVKIREQLNELNWIDSSLHEGDDSYSYCPFIILKDESTTVDNRARIYERGGVISISERLLSVDLLSGVVSAQDITGMVILHAEAVREKSKASFVVTLYRDLGNNWGFVKAITDQPESFFGTQPLRTRLKDLRLKQAILWPRFHVLVIATLSTKEKNMTRNQLEIENRGKTVTEIKVQMTGYMMKIQHAIRECLQACIGELKRHNPLLATEYWDIENVYDKLFVSRISATLSPQWHRISWTSKKLIDDLKTLKQLMVDLVTTDSLTFYQIVQAIVTESLKHTNNRVGGRFGAKPSVQPWLNLDEASTVISFAKLRALGTLGSKDDKRARRGGLDIGTEDQDIESYGRYVLEEQPKWDQLGLLIDDILYEKQHRSNEHDGPILIMCALGSSNQLRELLMNMEKHENSLTGRRKFTFRRVLVNDLKENYSQWIETTLATKKLQTDLKQEGTVKEEDDDDSNAELNTTRTFDRGKAIPMSKRRRTRGAASVAVVDRLYRPTETSDDPVELDPNLIKNEVFEPKSEDDDIVELARHDDPTGSNTNESFRITPINLSDQIIIEEYNENVNDSLLFEVGPSNIILYDPDVAFVRRVEIYQAIHKSSPAKAFFMYYGDSIEEQKFLLDIKKEKEAFSRLVKEKASLSKEFLTPGENQRFNILKSGAVNTRIAGGSNFRTEEDEFKLIVDVREFNSSTPNILYRSGFKLIPCMLTVGDYILSPQICVERKGIEDLKSSFASGRLYTQCEQMFRFYELPVLLIEFSESESFSLEPFSEVKNFGVRSTNSDSANKVGQQAIQSKLIMLLVQFPKLKILWLSSPYETAQIFAALKSNQEEPDVKAAVAKGLSNNADIDNPPLYNEEAIDLIKNIPGINNNNFYQIITRIKNIEDLVHVPQAKLEELLGAENGRKAYKFIHKVVA